MRLAAALVLAVISSPALARPQCDPVKPVELTQQSHDTKRFAIAFKRALKEQRWQDAKVFAYALEKLLNDNPITTIWGFCEGDVNVDTFLPLVAQVHAAEAQEAREARNVQRAPAAQPAPVYTCMQAGDLMNCIPHQ